MQLPTRLLIVVRVIAFCAGVSAICLPLVNYVLEGPLNARGRDVSGFVNGIWIAVLVGMPCLVVAYKGIRTDSESMRMRWRGVLCFVCGVVTLLISALISFGTFMLAEFANLPFGVLTTGAFFVGIILVAAGILTVITGLDMSRDLVP